SHACHLVKSVHADAIAPDDGFLGDTRYRHTGHPGSPDYIIRFERRSVGKTQGPSIVRFDHFLEMNFHPEVTEVLLAVFLSMIAHILQSSTGSLHQMDIQLRKVHIRVVFG